MIPPLASAFLVFCVLTSFRPPSAAARGNVAWVRSTSATMGSWKGLELDARGAELAVLARHGDTWMIEAIHWSSR